MSNESTWSPEKWISVYGKDFELLKNDVSRNLPEELNTLPESVEEVTIKGVKYRKVPARWEKVKD